MEPGSLHGKRGVKAEYIQHPGAKQSKTAACATGWCTSMPRPRWSCMPARRNSGAQSPPGRSFSPQRISTSGLNIDDKQSLNRSWDIHAERVLRCTDCHYSLNNPVYYQESNEKKPESLLFDPRRIDLGEYLYRPLHQFAKGQSAQGAGARI